MPDFKYTDKGFSHTFVYDGKTGDKEFGGEFEGTLTWEFSLQEKIHAENNGHFWVHITPTHKISGHSKKDLWEEVKAAIFQTKSKAKVKVIAAGQETKIVEIKREEK